MQTLGDVIYGYGRYKEGIIGVQNKIKKFVNFL